MSKLLSGMLMTTVISPVLTAGEPAVTPDKNAKAVTIQDRWSLPGILGAGVKTTEDYTDGNVFLVVPVISSLGQDGILGGDVLYLQPYSSWGEGGEVTASLGLGWRHLFNNQPVTAITRHDGHQAGFMEEGVFIGGNLFIDMLDTEADNQFWQLGFGVEAGTRYLEVRANYYLPLSDRQMAEEFRTRETNRSSRTSSADSVTPLNDPFATGNSIQQDALFATRQTTTTTTTTIERLFQRFEEGMEGWDAEVAVLVPGLDKYMDLKLIGGYYSFDNQPFGPQKGGTGNVEGWKAGAELRPVPAVVLSATWYEDERFVGDDWLFGFRMEVPFEMGDLGDGKGFWGRVADSFRPRRRHLAERMAEPVHRQNAAIKIANSVEKAEEKVNTSVKRVTRVVSQSSRRVVLADDIVFVNNGDAAGNGIQAGNAAGTGTAEQPLDTIQAAANVAQGNSNSTTRVWNVYTQGTVAGYAESVVADTGSVNFIGSGKLIQGVGNTTFGTGPAPLVNGGFKGTGIDFFGVTGYEITGGIVTDQFDSPYGIGVVNVGQFVIDSNNIHDVSSDGIFIEASSDVISKGLVTSNTLENNGDSAIEIVSDDIALLDVQLTNNTVGSHFWDHVEVFSHGESSLTLVASNNTFTGGSGVDAFSINSTGVSTLDFTALGNTIDDAFDGIGLFADDSSILTALLSGNTISNSDDDGIDLESNTSALLTATVQNNRFSFAASDYIESESFGTSVLNLNALNNVFNSATGDALFVSSYGSSTTNFTADHNIISDQLGNGIRVANADQATMNAIITNNVITNSALAGIVVDASNFYLGVGDLAQTSITITGNTIDGTISGSGLVLTTSLQQAGNIVGTASNNLILNAFNHGVEVVSDSTTPDTGISVLFNGNTVTGSGNDGIHLDEISGDLNFSGSVSNSVSGSGSNTIRSTGSPAGVINLNGTLFNLPQNF
ncbi:MAG: right-handed parallel beta-helix repeat-containing protein [Verrucomicrobium sp.]